MLGLILIGCAEPEGKSPKNQPKIEEAFQQPKTTSLFHSQKEKLFQISPKDERRKDPNIDVLLKTVERAIKQKDLTLLFSVMDEDIISSHGGAMYGYEDFKATWETEYQELWNKLNWIVSMGGFFEEDSVYRLPYCDDFKRFPAIPNSYDEPYGYGLCLDENTQLYTSPQCEINKSVDIGFAFSLLDLAYGMSGEKNGVLKINPVGTGIHGYVKSSDFYRSSDYCLILEKNKQGIWKITAFAPWD